jgi:hypothetical protein
MSKFISLLNKELKLTIRNYYLFIVLIIALILVLIIRFVVPSELNMEKTLYLHSTNEAEDKLAGTNYDVLKEKSTFYDTKEEIVLAMEDNYNSLGLIIDNDNGEINLELITQGYENEDIINMAIVDIQSYLGKIDFDDSSKVTILRKGSSLENIPLNLNIVPLAIMLESALMGLFLISVMLILEKDHKTIKAFVTTPTDVNLLLGAKLVTMLLYSFLSAVLIVIFTVGINVNWLNILILIGLTSIWSSCLGLTIANVYKSLTSAMMPLIIISLLLGAPVVSYFAPMFAPSYLKVMPTYSLMLGLREALFVSGTNTMFIKATQFSIILVVIFALSTLLTKRYAIEKN